MSEFGSVLRKFSPAWDGRLEWQLLGLDFVDMADVDPATDGRDIYSKPEHQVMDYSKPSGKDWKWYGYSLDSVKYPEDARLFLPRHQLAIPFIRYLDGRRYAYMTGMYAAQFVIYRFHGEIVAPSGAFFKSHWSRPDVDGDWPPNQPAQGEWYWHDANGDGRFNPDEFVQPANQTDALDGWGWWIDRRGHVWQGGQQIIRECRLRGFDRHHNPVYDYETVRTHQLPAAYTSVYRLEYHTNTDTMHMTGYTPGAPYDSNFWSAPGKILTHFDDWSTGSRSPRYQLTLPWDTTTNPQTIPECVSVAGDYIFVIEPFTAKIHVYDKDSAEEIRQISPGPEVGRTSGWIDIPYGVRAFRRSDGRYLVNAEDAAHGKVILYMWKPGAY